MTKHIPFFKPVLLLVFFACAVNAMEIKNLSQAVDVAGKQRMFTQRMLKDYAMVGMGNTFGKPKQDLEEIVTSFEVHLEALIRFNKDGATRESLEKVKILWHPIKITLEEKPERSKASKLQEDLEILLGQANDATNLFAKQTGKKSGEIINISGRQRMLSQRMASLYMLKTWGIEDPKFSDKMTKAMAQFKSAQDTLVSSGKNTPETLKLLHASAKAFIYFEYMRDAKLHVPSIIFKKSMEILKNMNTATGLYAKMGAAEEK